VSASRPLHDAIRALGPSSSVAPTYDGEAPGTAAAPWFVTNIETPDSIRSEAATHTAGTGRLRVTVTARTHNEAHYLLDAVYAAWRGKRVTVDGWNVGTLVQTEQSGPYKAGLTATDTDLRYYVAQVWFSFTCSPTT
jgi:hypothetical protein